MQRRDLLKIAGASAALLGLPSVGLAKQAWSVDPFSLGIASGSPTSNSLVLWTRLGTPALEAAGLTTKPVAVTWQLAHDQQFSRVVATGVVQATAALGHSVHAEVAGLEPGRAYFYRFIAGAANSTTGRTRTFPAPNADVKRLRLAYASCQQWGNGYYSAYRHMLAENLDFVLFLGDYVYEYPASRPVEIRPTTGGWITTLAGYRSRYELHKSDPDLQAIHAAYPWLVTWDDHEVQNDYASTHEGLSGTPVENFMARRRAAYQAFYENMPVTRASFAKLLDGQGDEAKVFGSVSFGRLATLYTLDDRQHRDLQACTPNNRPGSARIDPSKCDSLNQPQRTLLGNAQERWLSQQFASARSRWNLIGQQTLFGRRNFSTTGAQLIRNDGWDGYPAARRRLTDSMMQTRLSNPIVLGGDIHENWVGHVLSDYNNPDCEAIGVEFCGTSITSLSSTTPAQLAQQLELNPHFMFANAASRGYGVVELTPTQLTTTLTAVHDARDPKSGAFVLAKFAVEAGRAAVSSA
jgi:alkaline phosphatase D